jgi:putative sigma-54 modulation protein
MKQVRIVSRDFSLTTPIADRVSRRVSEILRRRGRPALEVRVVVGDTNGPRGGDDKYCVMLARLDGRDVRAERVDANLYVAIDQCSRRLDRSLREVIARRRLGRRVHHEKGPA